MAVTNPFDDWLQHVPDPVLLVHGVTASQIRFLRWNAAFARFVDLPADSRSEDALRRAMGKAGLLDAKPLERLCEAARRALSEGHYRVEWRFRDAAGQRTMAQAELTALPSLGAEAYCVKIRDITVLHAIQERLAASEARFRDLFEVATDGFGFVSVAGGVPTFIDCNASLTRLYGATHKNQVIGKTPLDFSPPLQPHGQPTLEYARMMVEQALRMGYARFDWFAHTLDGRPFWIDVTLTAQPSWGAEVVHFSGRDITDRKQAEHALARAEELARVTLHSIADGVITADTEGRVTGMNPVAERLTGWSQTEALGRPLDAVLPTAPGVAGAVPNDPKARRLPEQPAEMADTKILRSRGGAEYTIEDSVAPISLPDGRAAGSVTVFRDVTETRRLTAQLAYQARHDPLTGLPNRREFERRLDELVAQTRHGDAVHALCFIDLDQFKTVNDSCGHAAGDRLLMELCQVLERRVRRHDLLARLGGDEFGLLLFDCPIDQALTVARQLLAAVADFRFRWGEKSFVVGASIGLVPITACAVSAQELMSEADLACYTAKDLGRNRIHVSQPDDADLARRRGDMQWINELHAAVEEQRLLLYAQPIQALHGDPLPWFEVLLRLRQRDGRLVLPGAFLPAAERFGLMPLIDRYVLTRVLGRLRDPARRGDARLSVNLSGRSLEDADTIGLLEAYFDDPAHPAGQLCLELTETTAVSHLGRTRALIDRLRGAGCLFALDDFGTGVSSFAYLKHLPVDFLKLDGSFVRDITTEPIDHAMVEAIHRLSTIMGFQTIAEFVEDTATLELLRRIGVNYGQGFLLGQPTPIDSPAITLCG